MQRDPGEVFIVQGKILKHKTCMINIVENNVSFLKYNLKVTQNAIIIFSVCINFEDFT